MDKCSDVSDQDSTPGDPQAESNLCVVGCGRPAATADGFDKAYEIVIGNCSMCHAREPTWEGMRWPPKNVVLETKSDVARYAEQIHLHAALSRAMPPPNSFLMDNASREVIATWVRSARN